MRYHFFKKKHTHTGPHHESVKSQTSPKFKEVLSLDSLKSELKLQLPELRIQSNPFGCQTLIQATCTEQQAPQQEESTEHCAVGLCSCNGFFFYSFLSASFCCDKPVLHSSFAVLWGIQRRN